MIRAIFFDYDGVLTLDKTGSLTTCRYLSQATGIDISTVQAAFSPYSEGLTPGRTTHAGIWPAVCNALGRDVNIALLREAFESTPVNAGMFSLARRLKGKYFVGIITDNKKDRIDHLKGFQRLDLLFDPIVVSSEVGSNKESAAIFRKALNDLSLDPEACVFIDNSRANLVAPGALGFETLFHDDEKNDVGALIEALGTLGITLEDAESFDP